MPRSLTSRRLICSVLSLWLIAGAAAYAQFTASIQGVVQDASGAGVAKAIVRLVNTNTNVTAETTTDGAGNYHFVSLAPGRYSVTAEAAGFTKSQADISLLTEQNLSVPITLKVGSAT